MAEWESSRWGKLWAVGLSAVLKFFLIGNHGEKTALTA